VIELVTAHVLPAALSLLPAKMDTPEARVLLLAIALQESRCMERRQIRAERPALSFLQFEPGHLSGFAGVFRHLATRDLAQHVCRQLRYEGTDVDQLRRHSEHNDVLAFAVGRLLLWTLPSKLPHVNDREEAWRQYLEAWRPGQPRPETWAAMHEEARTRVTLPEVTS
jgi:hypothetical protein